MRVLRIPKYVCPECLEEYIIDRTDLGFRWVHPDIPDECSKSDKYFFKTLSEVSEEIL